MYPTTMKTIEFWGRVGTFSFYWVLKYGCRQAGYAVAQLDRQRAVIDRLQRARRGRGDSLDHQ